MGSGKPIVYVVDDEKVIVETLAMILDQSGFAARPFQDPREALAAAEAESPPNLLIADIVMPGMSGIELAIQIERLCPRCKILLFSGQAATANLLEDARRQGYEFEVLAKPIHPADLLAKLRACSRNGGQEQTKSHETSKPQAVR
jgi:DNA-binding NtrC family response regulator